MDTVLHKTLLSWKCVHGCVQKLSSISSCYQTGHSHPPTTQPLFTSSLLLPLACLTPQSLQCSSPELAIPTAAPMRYISSTPKSRGVLMRHGRGLCSSFIILLPTIPAPFYQAPAGPRVFSSDINQLSGQAGAPIMPY